MHGPHVTKKWGTLKTLPLGQCKQGDT